VRDDRRLAGGLRIGLGLDDTGTAGGRLVFGAGLCWGPHHRDGVHVAGLRRRRGERAACGGTGVVGQRRLRSLGAVTDGEQAGGEVVQQLPVGTVRTAVVGTKSHVVAVGQQYVAADEESSEAAVWVGTPGPLLSRVSDDAAFGVLPGYQAGQPKGPVMFTAMTAVAATNTGRVVAVGSGGLGAAVWTSTDLASWTESELPPSSAQPGGDTAAAVAVNGSTLLVGGERDDRDRPAGPATHTVPVVWVGTVGGVLSAVILPATDSQVAVDALVVAGGVDYAAGYSRTFAGGGASHPVVWSSRDGRTWNETVLAGTEVVLAAVGTASGVVFGGTTDTTAGKPARALWWAGTSADRLWAMLPPGAGQITAMVAVPGGGVLAGGARDLYGQAPAPLWRLDIPS
jgi:hypothetical protein